MGYGEFIKQCLLIHLYLIFLTEMEETMRIRVNELSSEASSAVLQRQFLSSMPQIDPNVLSDIEIEAQYLAANIDNITENLCNLLHSVSILFNFTSVH